jgi:hypothetical protein
MSSIPHSVLLTSRHATPQAIDWAHSQGAHIVCLALGLENGVRHPQIDVAIERARASGTTFFAAASNRGANRPRAYPANRPGGVVCVHASDGHGNSGGLSPAPLARRLNIATLGIAVPACWRGRHLRKSGTSFATPVAAALVVDVLDLVRLRCASLTDDELRCLCTFDTIQEILREMSVEVDQYDYLSPGKLFNVNRVISVVLRILRGGQ